MHGQAGDRVPEPDGGIAAGRTEQLTVRGQSHGGERSRRLKGATLLARGKVPNVNLVVVPGGRQGLAIGGKGQGPNPAHRVRG